MIGIHDLLYFQCMDTTKTLNKSRYFFPIIKEYIVIVFLCLQKNKEQRDPGRLSFTWSMDSWIGGRCEELQSLVLVQEKEVSKVKKRSMTLLKERSQKKEVLIDLTFFLFRIRLVFGISHFSKSLHDRLFLG